MPVQCICERCGATFSVSPAIKARGRRYCSMACTRVERITRTCRRCGKEFSAKAANAARYTLDYCSWACRFPALTPERFWARVDRSGECWLWTGALNDAGYGKVRRQGKYYRAHRVAWELVNGPIPRGMLVRHLVCDNPPCVRMDHLALGSDLDNIADKVSKRRQPHGDQHWSQVSPDRVARGERARHAKLTEGDVRAIREEAARGAISRRALGEKFGVGQARISAILLRQNWKHV